MTELTNIASYPAQIGTTEVVTRTPAVVEYLPRPTMTEVKTVTETPLVSNLDTTRYSITNNPTVEIEKRDVTVVSKPPELATKSQLSQSMTTIVTWIIVTLIVLIIIAIIGFLIYWSTRPAKNTIVCAAQDDCSPGNYCSSSGICIPGSGATSGTVCGTNDDCRFGLSCINGKCGTSTETEIVELCTPLSLPAKFRMKTVIGGNTYYINVNNINSPLAAAADPSTSYTYNNSTEILSLNSTLLPPSTLPIGVHAGATNNGQMFASAGAGHEMCISGTTSAATLTLSCGSILEYAGPSTLPTNVYFPAVSTTQDCKSFPVSNPARRVSVIIEEV